MKEGLTFMLWAGRLSGKEWRKVGRGNILHGSKTVPPSLHHVYGEPGPASKPERLFPDRHAASHFRSINHVLLPLFFCHRLLHQVTLDASASVFLYSIKNQIAEKRLLRAPNALILLRGSEEGAGTARFLGFFAGRGHMIPRRR